MQLESMDNLITALIDVEANMGLFKKELARRIQVDMSDIDDPFLKSEMVNGVVKQYLYVGLSDKVSMGKLLNLGFEYFEDGFLVFEVGDIVL